ncbi:MAG: ABC transporter ATP-binding protein [Proteobacteria bacterium]|nr:ABC transporter ATP-binding protein [Pseudomonadota bacterium]
MAGENTGRAPLIRVEGVTRRFGAFTAVDDLSLDVETGEFFALLGPSGCGKTTLLRMLAGFETPDAGRILLDGADITAVPPHLRPVNMMFQSYALFPHLTVAGNIAFGLKREGMSGAVLAERVAEMMRLARLQGLETRKPHELSGGQRQRVALARALAKRPRVLLLDEPLAALDKKLREETQFELKDIQRRLGLTFIIVTHDQDEAMSLASRIGVMQKGQLAQVGPPAEVYNAPRTRYVAEFVGDVNILNGTVAGPAGIAVPGIDRVLNVSMIRSEEGAPVTIAIRPEGLVVGAAPGLNHLAATFEDSVYLGGGTLCRFRLQNGAIIRVSVANTRQSRGFSVGEGVMLSFAPDAAVVLAE